MSKRRITTPETVICKGKSYSFEHFVLQMLNDRRFGQTADRLHSRARLREAFTGAQPGDQIDLHGDDWAILRDCVKQPQFQPLPDGTFTSYDPAIGEASLPYIDAIVEAGKAPAHPQLVDADEAAS